MRLLIGCKHGRFPVWVFAALCLANTAVAEDRALFWAIESGQDRAGYLLGTIHSEDPRVLEFSEPFIQALSSSSSFAMELVPDLPNLARLAAVMTLPSGQDLACLIGKKRFADVARAIDPYGVKPGELSKMKPWAALMTLSVPPPETGYFMDFSLSLRASGKGLEVLGLETLDEQLGFLENMPLEHQLTLLDHAIAEAGQVQDLHDQMVNLYLQGDLQALFEETEQQLAQAGRPARDFFIEQGIVARNKRMLSVLLEALEQGTVFVAVGALHLPGEQGLINLLRTSGYRLVPQPMPFPAGQVSNPADLRD